MQVIKSQHAMSKAVEVLKFERIKRKPPPLISLRGKEECWQCERVGNGDKHSTHS